MTKPVAFAGSTEPIVQSWVVRPLDDILVELTDVPASRSPGAGPLIVAIDGRSAGGKTTVARRLAAGHRNAALVSTDDVAWHHSFFGWDALLVVAAGPLLP